VPLLHTLCVRVTSLRSLSTSTAVCQRLVRSARLTRSRMSSSRSRHKCRCWRFILCIRLTRPPCLVLADWRHLAHVPRGGRYRASACTQLVGRRHVSVDRAAVLCIQERLQRQRALRARRVSVRAGLGRQRLLAGAQRAAIVGQRSQVRARANGCDAS
jgi:hypothetical protein